MSGNMTDLYAVNSVTREIPENVVINSYQCYVFLYIKRQKNSGLFFVECSGLFFAECSSGFTGRDL